MTQQRLLGRLLELVVTFAGKTTVNSLYGTRVAVLAGDFLFAQSSWYLANLDNLEVSCSSAPSALIAVCLHSTLKAAAVVLLVPQLAGKQFGAAILPSFELLHS